MTRLRRDSRLKKIFLKFKPVLKQGAVNYYNEVLANQIYSISIILFIKVLIIILLIEFMVNIVILVYSDKLLKIFTNKYIR